MPKLGIKGKFKKVKVLKNMKINPRYDSDKGRISKLELGDRKRTIIIDKRLKNWKNKVKQQILHFLDFEMFNMTIFAILISYSGM